MKVLRKGVALLLTAVMVALALLLPVTGLEPRPVEEALLPEGGACDLLQVVSEQEGSELTDVTITCCSDGRRIVRNRSPSVGAWATKFGKWCFNARDQSPLVA